MAEFNYFGTKAELISLLQSALVEGYSIQSKKHLPAPVPEFCNTSAEIADAVAQGQYAFILTHPAISRFPIGLQSLEKDNRQYWAIRTSEGGPAIEAYFWAPYERDGKRIIPCWLLAYHGKIINPSTNQFEPAGAPMKAAFTKLIGSLRKNARRIKGRNGTAYVSSGVEAMLAEGWRLSSQYDDEIQ